MNRRTTLVLKLAWLIALSALITGCTPEASSASTTLQDVQAFAADLGRQVIAALLL